MLVPQSLIEQSNLSTVLHNKQLFLVDAKATSQLLQILKPQTQISQTNGLYYFTPTDLHNILTTKHTPDIADIPFTDTYIANSIARYETISFPTTKSLVLFWHDALGHPNKQKMISIVRNKIYNNLPKQLTESAINSYFPDPCYKCSLGNLQAQPNPPPAPFNPHVPVGAFWAIDFKKFSGADNERQILS